MKVEDSKDRTGVDQYDGQVLAIVGGTIIDGVGGAPIDDGVLIVDGRRIGAVGDCSIRVPPDAIQISAEGKFIIPGLMDPHASLVAGIWPPDLSRCEGRYDEVAIEAAQLALRGGVTSVFDSLGPRDPLIKARDAINEGRAVGARIFLSGHWVGCGGPFSPDLYDHGEGEVGEDSAERKLASLISAANPSFKARINSQWELNIGEALIRMSFEEVRREVRNYIQSGIDFVTYTVNAHRLGAYQYIAFSSRVQRMIVEEAHCSGLPVKAFFASTEEGIHMALDAEVDILAPASWEGKPLSTATLARIVQKGIFVYLVVNPNDDIEWYRQQPANALYPGLVKQMETAEVDHRGLIRAGARVISAGWSALHSPEPLKLISSGMAPGSHPAFGEGHIRGLRGLQQKGMTPMDALMSATRNVARAYKMDKDFGTLERGKIADLVILDKNPLADVQNYRHIHLVMKEGQIIDRDALPTQRLWSAPSSQSH